MAVTLQSSNSTTKQSRDQSAIAAAEKIVSVLDIDDDKLKMCLYGRNKIGKTLFACSTQLKTLVIDCNEKGYASVRKRKNVDIYMVQKWEDIDPIYWLLRKGGHGYEVIVIDTITMMAAIGMKWVLKDDADRDMSKDPMAPSRLSYQKLGEMMADAIIKFRNLPYHIVFNAQEKTSSEEDDDGNTLVETHPELSPKPRSVLLSATNIIGRIYAREVEGRDGKKKMERRIIFGTVPKYVSGNRFSDTVKAVERLGPENVDNFANLLARIYNGGSSADAS